MDKQIADALWNIYKSCNYNIDATYAIYREDLEALPASEANAIKNTMKFLSKNGFLTPAPIMCVAIPFAYKLNHRGKDVIYWCIRSGLYRKGD